LYLAPYKITILADLCPGNTSLSPGIWKCPENVLEFQVPLGVRPLNVSPMLGVSNHIG